MTSDARTASRMHDAGVAIAISLLLPAFVLLRGDPLYFGLWYYLAVPAGVLIIAALARARPRFMTGAALATALTFVPWMAVNLGNVRQEGLIGLGHLSSLPGIAVGALVTALFARRAGLRPATGFLLGSVGVLLGDAINTAVTCNTMIECGGLFRAVTG